MRLMITRPLEDAAPLAEELAGLGIESLVEPLLSIELSETGSPDLSGVQALLLTSANGVRAYCALASERRLPVYGVGDATARAAKDSGFATVISAAGDVASLAALVREKLNPRDGALVHVAGSKVAGDLAGLLGQAGFEYRRVQLYHARKAVALSQLAINALEGGTVDGVVLFSPRTAESFVDLLRKAGAADLARGLIAFCLSDAVAARAGALAWSQVVVAATPDQAALIKSVKEMNPGA
ncbi:MAG: uroporphyrinogen-III synthase [Rhodospirillales bacterium]|nr:uroporphyrinogen-III synthase [Rhodospirillales bacterium]